MEAIIKFLNDGQGTKPFAVRKENVKPGDFTYNDENIILQANQSTCIFFDYKIIGPVNKGVEVFEGEKVDLLFTCKAEKDCSYPFCGTKCPGNKDGFIIAGKEDRF